MDNIKDIRRTSEISKFVDNQSVRTNPFGQNMSADQAYRRAERIAEAIHLVTNHIPSEEPARIRVREMCANLLSIVISLRSGFRSSGGVDIKNAHACIREMISLVRILAVSGGISFQNADAVVEALDDLGYFLSAAQRSSLAEGTVITREDLSPRPRMALTGSVNTSVHNQESSRTDRVVIKDKQNSGTIGPNMKHKHEEVRLRAESVLDILRSGDSLSIKDIAAHFPEYSEKTVQRALASLVKSALVRFKGMKRWRTYELERPERLSSGKGNKSEASI